ncbi:hypothetical protein [Rhodococcus sp. ARC_M6]|uniref:hypothetical protein n=1 Tax=Rhodococcus sp. ARC_M6 TaxID=2928852 RepID=UPI001FB3C6E3|nr:hypothetical protein [Rhodococcus sp. ARC_M6]MCJ0906204.1 hypothetical protein [Rhodococcus sp. ARC_M6]
MTTATYGTIENDHTDTSLVVGHVGADGIFRDILAPRRVHSLHVSDPSLKVSEKVIRDAVVDELSAHGFVAVTGWIQHSPIDVFVDADVARQDPLPMTRWSAEVAMAS